MKKQSYTEKFLILGLMLAAGFGSAFYYVLATDTNRVFLYLTVVPLLALVVWIVGRVVVIYRVREVESRHLTMDELRAELIKSHDWLTGSQIDELVARYMALQQGHFQKWLYDEKKAKELADALLEEETEGAPEEQDD